MVNSKLDYPFILQRLPFENYTNSVLDPRQNGSSADASPQEEECDFSVSDSESFSEEANVDPQEVILQGCHRGIVNPNYPGFQHLAHTLNYSLEGVVPDSDVLEYNLSGTAGADSNRFNNNPGEEEAEYEKIDSVNRLDSVENIQKVV